MAPERLLGQVFGVPPATVTDETSNKTVPAWDSLGHITLMAELESAYGISVTAEDTMKLTSVGAIKRFLTERGVRW